MQVSKPYIVILMYMCDVALPLNRFKIPFGLGSECKDGRGKSSTLKKLKVERRDQPAETLPAACSVFSLEASAIRQPDGDEEMQEKIAVVKDIRC